MTDLPDATEKICQLKGSLLSMQVFIAALAEVLPSDARSMLAEAFREGSEAQRTALLNAIVSEHVLASFELETQRTSAILAP